MRTNVIKNTFSLPVDSLQAINQIGPTIAMASAIKEEVSVESQVSSFLLKENGGGAGGGYVAMSVSPKRCLYDYHNTFRIWRQVASR